MSSITMSGSSLTRNFKPGAVTTWDFGTIALRKCQDCWNNDLELFQSGTMSAIDLVVAGIKSVEEDDRDQYYVGIGGLPNADGVMEMDAAIMDHGSRYGAVIALQEIKYPIVVARTVMEKSPHNVLAGDGALKWALSQGLERENVLTEKCAEEWRAWRDSHSAADTASANQGDSHDTVGLICLDAKGRLACGTSTSGWKFKHPGRVGDAPLIGSGLYCDGEIGAAVATGDGEDIMRSCLSYQVVESLRLGYTPQEACERGIQRVLRLKEKDDIHMSTTSTGTTVAESTAAGENEIKERQQEGKGGKSSGKTRMHDQITIGVVCMDALGNIGAASTLCKENLHRGKPYFPAPYLRFHTTKDSGISSSSNSSNNSLQYDDFKAATVVVDAVEQQRQRQQQQQEPRDHGRREDEDEEGTIDTFRFLKGSVLGDGC